MDLLNYVRQGSFNWKDFARTSYISGNNLGIILTDLANLVRGQFLATARPLVPSQTRYRLISSGNRLRERT